MAKLEFTARMGALAAVILLGSSAPVSFAQTPPAGGGAPGGLVGAPTGSAETSGSAFVSRPRVTPAAMKEALEGEGYTEVEILRETAEGYDAQAKKGGARVDLKLDPAGRIIPTGK